MHLRSGTREKKLAAQVDRIVAAAAVAVEAAPRLEAEVDVRLRGGLHWGGEVTIKAVGELDAVVEGDLGGMSPGWARLQSWQSDFCVQLFEIC